MARVVVAAIAAAVIFVGVAAQGKAAAGLAAFHDFQFTDRLVDSGISFKDRIVDDAGQTYKAAHYAT